MNRTIKLEDMRLFAGVAEARSFTAAARAMGMPKQTLSRRIAELEQALDVQLLHRTTRRLHLTEVGAAYAERCAEIVRLADEANRAVVDDRQAPRGTLRITADPAFGEAFLTGLVMEYASQWPEVQVEVVLARRRVDLVEEGFDVAFRVGRVDDPALTATSLGPARIRYCASPGYLARHGTPASPEDLQRHECILVISDGMPARWPFRGPRGDMLVPVSGRLRFSSSGMAHAAALHGLGIAIMPEFACAEDLRRERLVSVLDDWVVEVGAVWLVHPSARQLTARVRTFVDLAVERLARQPPWIPAGPAGEGVDAGAARSHTGRGKRGKRGKPGRGSRLARGSRA
jgi:DNA-binding transcriptional LysR family regulator